MSRSVSVLPWYHCLSQRRVITGDITLAVSERSLNLEDCITISARSTVSPVVRCARRLLPGPWQLHLFEFVNLHLNLNQQVVKRCVASHQQHQQSITKVILVSALHLHEQSLH